MTTGDLKNNLRKFHAELKLINYVNELDIEGLSIGRPSAFLPILHFVLTEFSIELAQYFYSKDYELLGKNDKNFVSVIYKIVRDEFNSKPPLTKEQFFTLGFAERKLQFVTSMIQLCRKKSDALKPKKRKNMLSSNAAKTSKMNIHIPGRTAGTTVGTKNSTGATSSNNPPLVTMPTESLASHFPKPEFDKTVGSKQVTGRAKSDKCLGYFPDKTLSEDQTLRDYINLTMPNDDPDDVPRSRNIPGPSCVMGVEKNISSRSVQSIPDTFTNMNAQLLQETHWYSRDNVFHDGRGLYATKENVCPNTGNDLVIDGDDNVDGLISTRSDQKHSLMLSPIPVSNRMTCTGFDSLSEKQVSNYGPRPSTIPFVNYSNSPECSKHIFVTQPSEGVETHSRNEAIDVSISDKHSPEYVQVLDYVKEQEKRINVLEREAEKKNGRIEELVRTNAKLNARVMVLETAVALIQEKIES